MNKSLLDTDMVSEIHKGSNKLIKHREREYRAEWGGLTLSAVTVMEVVYGHWATGSAQGLSAFVASLANDEVLPFNATTAVLAGKIFAELLRTGEPIGHADPMIAATAIEHGLVLVTGNVKHFERIQHLGFPLILANWREAER